MQFGAEFEALIARFSPNSTHPIALAVSGGSDSMALLMLAHDWAGRSGRPLSVLTVDHKLRAASASEADLVAHRTQQLGHQHQTLVWETPKPSQGAARGARYGLMSDALRETGVELLLTGHTFDDVVETALLRRRRGIRSASIAGPSLAAPVPAWPSGRGVTLLRPLIHSRRSELRSYLKTKDAGWIEDPSNQDPRYERVRVREFLARHPALSALAAGFVSKLQEQLSGVHSSLGKDLLNVAVQPDGLIDTGTTAGSRRLLKLVARVASGTAEDPRGGAVVQLLETLIAPGARHTLGGAWFQKTGSGYIVGRDPGPTPVAENDVHDGRFERAPDADLPSKEAMSFLVRQSAPPDSHWREIMSERLAHLALCYQTPLLKPVQR